jgi:RHS repeat-associated protein
VYDGAGRLVQAYVNGVSDPYQFNYSASHSCGVATAGKNTNRTTLVIGASTETYCYNAADQLTSYTTGAATVTFSYDAHGNTVAANSQSFTYDAENRHLSTSDGGVTIRYTRDATGAIVERSHNGTTTARFSGPAVLDAAGNVVSRTLRLPGGVLLTKSSAGDTWSYPNLHGDIAAAANAAGVKQGTTNIYDPYGNLKTGQAIVNLTNDFNYAWPSAQPTEHNPTATGGVPRVEMGARQYAPILGRFLSTDPIDGGSANDYEYTAGDPINRTDYNGTEAGAIPFMDLRNWLYSNS